MTSPKIKPEFEIDDCWKRIGVWGDKQCPELISCHHCRNCEVYSRAGRQLLDRRPPAGYMQAWTKQLAEPQQESMPGQVSLFIFRIGPEWFAIPTRQLAEVLELRNVHSIPHRSNPILLGLVNVRGEMQLCVSVGKLLGVDKDFTKEESDDSKAIGRLLLISLEGERLAFYVSEACGIHSYHPSELRELPSTLPEETSVNSKGLLRWNGHHVAVLDEKILFEKLLRSIQ
ncbi:chemotaxis-related protein WspD [Mariprofundus aestuarium]|uniref:Chemotaxis protein CheW n=1 Tax=Mariprofundus aestuarium TaxID=1921086 RepID=A0A2K8KW30_MARES|nr:chemotaxis protein CheW [Mariprofundus aestuarium]ATX78842.1 chemotaxis-related protein WspD [Mariprofundus aestuarium]